MNFDFQTTVDEALKDGAPNGVDCFFDNVGGIDATKVINNHMNTFGRISGCGAISGYNDKEPVVIPSIQGSMVFKVCFLSKNVMVSIILKIRTCVLNIPCKSKNICTL